MSSATGSSSKPTLSFLGMSPVPRRGPRALSNWNASLLCSSDDSRPCLQNESGCPESRPGSSRHGATKKEGTATDSRKTAEGSCPAPLSPVERSPHDPDGKRVAVPVHADTSHCPAGGCSEVADQLVHAPVWSAQFGLRLERERKKRKASPGPNGLPIFRRMPNSRPVLNFTTSA